MLLPLPNVRAEEPRKPSGKVYIDQVQTALIGSGNLGGRTLEFAGKSYRFTIGGLGSDASASRG